MKTDFEIATTIVTTSFTDVGSSEEGIHLGRWGACAGNYITITSVTAKGLRLGEGGQGGQVGR